MEAVCLYRCEKPRMQAPQLTREFQILKRDSILAYRLCHKIRGVAIKTANEYSAPRGNCQQHGNRNSKP